MFRITQTKAPFTHTYNKQSWLVECQKTDNSFGTLDICHQRAVSPGVTLNEQDQQLNWDTPLPLLRFPDASLSTLSLPCLCDLREDIFEVFFISVVELAFYLLFLISVFSFSFIFSDIMVIYCNTFGICEIMWRYLRRWLFESCEKKFVYNATTYQVDQPFKPLLQSVSIFKDWELSYYNVEEMFDSLLLYDYHWIGFVQ